MKTIAIKGEKREGLGKAATKQIRNQGKVPCVIYGGAENINFSVYEADFSNLVYTPNSYLVRLDIEGNQRMAILQDMQFHPVSEAIRHADFLEVSADKAITTTVPVALEGSSPGVIAGGNVQVKISKLAVRAMYKDLPDSIVVNIDNLVLGKSVKVSEITLPNVELLDPAENSVVSCLVTRAAKTDDELEGEDGEGEEGEEGEGEESEESAE
jgi:large subunit ribosomal protein L25